MKKLLYSAIIGVTAFTIVGGAVALANGLDDTAGLLGITTDELKTQLEDKSMPEILDENGITHQQMFELRESHMLEKQAEILGISVDELKTRLEDKTFAEILDEEGLTHADLMELHQEQKKTHMTERLQQMVDDGEITQEQMQEKLQWMEDNGGKFHGKGFGMHGMHDGFGYGKALAN